jgi:hypothetical protein
MWINEFEKQWNKSEKRFKYIFLKNRSYICANRYNISETGEYVILFSFAKEIGKIDLSLIVEVA